MEKKELVKEVHFVVEGQFIADLARTRVEEGAWKDAQDMLTDSFGGMTVQQAQEILKGTATLTGTSADEEGVGYEELPQGNPLQLKMNEGLEWMYADVFGHGDKHFKPYARVASWGSYDFDYVEESKQPSVCIGSLEGLTGSELTQLVTRCQFYMRDRKKDVVVIVKDDESVYFVLAEETGSPPPWFRQDERELSERLVDVLEAGSLELQGAKANDESTYHANPFSAAREQKPAPVKPVAASTPRTARSLVDNFIRQVDEAKTPEELSSVGKRFEREFEGHRQRENLDLIEEADERIHDQIYERQLASYKERIQTQAEKKGGFFQLKLSDREGNPPKTGPSFVSVPLHPFLLWSLRGFDFERNGKERPDWNCVCPMGMKMMMDDPHHSDWMLGAGLSLEDTYSLDDDSLHARVMSAAYSRRADLVDEWASHKFVTLAKGKHTYVSGEVYLPAPNQSVPAGAIAVVPSAGPAYQLAMETACKVGPDGYPGAIICDTGGKLAHLAIVGREMACTVLMMPDATKRFVKGQRLSISLTEGTIQSLF